MPDKVVVNPGETWQKSGSEQPVLVDDVYPSNQHGGQHVDLSNGQNMSASKFVQTHECLDGECNEK